MNIGHTDGKPLAVNLFVPGFPDFCDQSSLCEFMHPTLHHIKTDVAKLFAIQRISQRRLQAPAHIHQPQKAIGISGHGDL